MHEQHYCASDVNAVFDIADDMPEIGGTIKTWGLKMTDADKADQAAAGTELTPMLRGWREMSTSLVEKDSDARLLEQIECLPINGGWGLIAELMKRYSRVVGV